MKKSSRLLSIIILFIAGCSSSKDEKEIKKTTAAGINNSIQSIQNSRKATKEPTQMEDSVSTSSSKTVSPLEFQREQEGGL